LVSYDFEEDLIPTSKTIEVLKDIVLDESFYKTDILKEKANSLLRAHKSNILKLYSERGYDDYVTGGGTTVTDRHYQNSFDKYREMGLHWECVYEEIEVDIILK
jgi:hypothetical protein